MKFANVVFSLFFVKITVMLGFAKEVCGVSIERNYNLSTKTSLRQICQKKKQGKAYA